MKNQLFIDGQWLDSANGARFPTINPATEETITEVSRAGREDVNRAVDAAHRAMQGTWKSVTPAQRSQLIFALADAVEAHAQELAELETLDVGKPISLSMGEVKGVASTLRFCAGATDKIYGDTIPLGQDYLNFTVMEPLGVTAHIIPWNSPISMMIRSVAPALAAGCTTVIKPAEQSPLTALRFASLAQEVGFPDGVINVVTGYGNEAGAPLVEHPLVRGVTFTGSVETGKTVMALAAKGIKPVVLELGGKSPMIVFPDADLSLAVESAARGFLTNCGQVCVAATRLVLHKQIHDEFLERLREHVANIQIGHGMNDPDMGPLVSQEQFDRVVDYWQIGHAQGARLVTGGKRPEGFERGYFVEPTIFDRVTSSMRIAQEEIFGPFTVALSFDTDAEAVAIANDVQYGLAAGVFSQDITRALTTVRDIEAGIIWVNQWFIGGVQSPVGGYKQSGIGREKGMNGIMNYVQTKSVGVRL